MISEPEYAILNAIMTRNSQATFRQICERVLARSDYEIRGVMDRLLERKLLLVADERRPVRYGLSMAGFTAWNTFAGEEVSK